MASETKKDNIFGKEENVRNHVREVIETRASRSPENILDEYNILSKNYEELLGQTKLVTSVSDRLQGKLNKAYDKIQKINSEIEARNIELQETIDELTKARASKKAATIVIILAVMLFLVSEGVLEPIVEANTQNPYIGFAFKGVIALLIKPLESLVEKQLIKNAVKNKRNVVEEAKLKTKEVGLK